MLECLVDGEIRDQVPATDRGFQYGDGLFETIAVIGGKPRFWQRHIDRLKAGCEQLGMPRVQQAVLLRDVLTVSAGHTRCVVKIVLTRRPSERGYAPGTAETPRRTVSAHTWPEVDGNLKTIGVNTRVCQLRLGLQPALGGIKHLNRLEQVLARSEWNDPAIQEGILMDREDHVISGVSSNLFAVFSGRLLTPRLDRCGIRGVMRAAILDAFRERCEQRRIMIDMLPEAAELFVCNSIRGILPVRRVDHWEYEIGPVTREVQGWLVNR